MTTAAGRSTVSYLVKCALPAGHQITKQDQYGTSYTFAGSIGLAPQYENGACDSNCQEALSACMMAHINTAGIHIPLWIVGPDAAVGWGQSPWYPTREGTFFGNIFQPDASGRVRAHYCTARSVISDTVPGRLGANQSGTPYTDPYTASPYCDDNCMMGGLLGVDGAASCPADGHSWTHPITVWRGQTFQAESSTLFGRAKAIGCYAGVCSNGYRVGMIDQTSGVTFNYVHSAASGTQSIGVYYVNGDRTDDHRSFNISVNNGPAQNFYFPVIEYGNFNKVGGVTVPLTGFLQGGNNTIRFVADGTHLAPDLDWIEIMPGQGWTAGTNSAGSLRAEAETGTMAGQARSYSGCTNCSAGARVGSFNQSSSLTMGNLKASTSGVHTVVVYYSNGASAARSMYIKVNGNPVTLFSNTFKPTGSWTTIGSASLTLAGFTAGSANTITFSTDATFSAPDLDFIEVN